MQDVRRVLDAELHPVEKLLMVTLIAHRNGQTGQCNPSVPTIAQKVGRSEREVYRLLAKLEATGYVRREQRRGRATQYHILTPDTHVTPDTDDRGRGDTDVRGRGDTDVRGPLTPTSPERTKENVLDPSPTPPHGAEAPVCEVSVDEVEVDEDDPRRRFPPLGKLPRDASGHRTYPHEFEGAFAAMPKRKGSNSKADAYKAWRARVLQGAEPFRLEAAADAYREHVEHEQIEPRYVQMAKTFFGPSEHWLEWSGVEPRLDPREERRRRERKYWREKHGIDIETRQPEGDEADGASKTTSEPETAGISAEGGAGD